MSGCTVTSINATNGCTGKCSGSACADAKAVWVLAACEGVGMLFEKGTDKTFTEPSSTSCKTLTVPNLCDMLSESHKQHRFNQLIVVGSPVDIAWVHASLPAEVARTVVAEVRYPLLAAWFADEQGIGQLKQALNTVVAIT